VPDRFDRDVPAASVLKDDVLTGDAPLYKQVYEALRGEIMRGERAEQSALPAEGELARRFKVSRITIRHALQLLAFEGFIRKQKARNAVVLARHPARAGWHIDSIEDIIAAAGDATLKILSYRQEASPETAAVLGVADTTRLNCLRSMLMRDGKAFARSIIYFHPRIGSRLRRRDFNDVIVFRVMQRELGVRLREITHTVRAELATTDDAALLACKPRDPILATRLVYRSDADLVVEVAYTRHPAREYSLTYTLGRRA
jgi:GntR family transcriptional regulator